MHPRIDSREFSQAYIHFLTWMCDVACYSCHVSSTWLSFRIKIAPDFCLTSSLLLVFRELQDFLLFHPRLRYRLSMRYQANSFCFHGLGGTERIPFFNTRYRYQINCSTRISAKIDLCFLLSFSLVSLVIQTFSSRWYSTTAVQTISTFHITPTPVAHRNLALTRSKLPDLLALWEYCDDDDPCCRSIWASSDALNCFLSSCRFGTTKGLVHSLHFFLIVQARWNGEPITFIIFFPHRAGSFKRRAWLIHHTLSSLCRLV